MNGRPRVAIVGLGVNGLCTAWALIRAGFRGELLLLDRFPAGHGRGSSHGAERITRTTYATAAFAADARRAQNELWPALQRDVGRVLVTPGPAVFWGPESGPLPLYARAMAEAGGAVEELSPAAARLRFPSMTFPDAERVLVDPNAGVLHAAETLSALEGWLGARGSLRRVVQVDDLRSDDAGVDLLTAEGVVRAEAVVCSAGPWLPGLLPAYANQLIPVRQHVGFWEMEVRAGEAPAWVHLGPDGLHYGLPSLAGGSMKAAFHRTSGAADVPDVVEEADAERIADMGSRLNRWFAPAPGSLVRSETCWYTNAPGDQFVIEPCADHPRVLALSACSGHAFKMGPLTGFRAAENVLRMLGSGS